MYGASYRRAIRRAAARPGAVYPRRAAVESAGSMQRAAARRDGVAVVQSSAVLAGRLI